MERFLPSDASPLHKALLNAAIYALIAIVGFVTLPLISYYMPGNYSPLRADFDSPFNRYMPANNEISSELVFMQATRPSPDTAAALYPDSHIATENFNAWGRQDGLSRFYVAVDRCTLTGERRLKLAIHPFATDAAAQAFMAFHPTISAQYAAALQPLDFSDQAFQVFTAVPSQCIPNEQDIQYEFVFRHGAIVSMVTLTAVDHHHLEAHLQEQAFRLARIIDRKLP